MDPHVHIGSNERGKENTPHTRGKTQTNKQKQTANTGITKGWLGGSPPLHVHITIRIRRKGYLQLVPGWSPSPVHFTYNIYIQLDSVECNNTRYICKYINLYITTN